MKLFNSQLTHDLKYTNTCISVSVRALDTVRETVEISSSGKVELEKSQIHS